MPTFEFVVDDRDWQSALDELVALIPGVLKDAGEAGAESIKSDAQLLLSMNAHGAGTYSDAPAGGPPGEITGELADSYLITSTDDGALVGPTADYAREQELGGPMRGHLFMRWVNEGGRWQRRLVELPSRPYHKPATELTIDSGDLTRIYVEYLERAILEVTG